MREATSVEWYSCAHIGFDAIETLVLRSRLIATGDLVTSVYVVYHSVIP
jgi:hypothetical protein